MTGRALSLKWVLTLCILIVALGCVSTLLFFTHRYRQSLNEGLGEHFDSALSLQTDNIQDEVDQAKINVRRLLAMLQILELEGKSKALPYLSKVMAENVRYQPYQYNTYFALGKELSRKYFGTNGYVFTVSKTANGDGATSSSTGGAGMQEKIWTDPAYQTSASEVWYQAARTSRECVVTNPYFDQQYMKVWMFTVGQGIYDGEKFQGMVGIDIELEKLLQTVEDVTLGSTGGMLIVNRETGLVLTRSEGGKRDFLDAPTRLKAYLYEAGTGWKELLGSSVSLSEMQRNGKAYVVSTRRVRDLPWTLVAFQARSEYEGNVERAARSFEISSALMLALLGGVAYLLYVSLASPMEALAAAMRKVGTRGGGLTVPVSGTLETRLMGEMFNGMSGTLEESFRKLEEANQTLEERVEQRTAELKTTQQQLIAQEKLASLGALTAGIAHEIKNPLNFVINFSELSQELVDELREGGDLGETIDLLEQNMKKIAEHGRRADSIVKNMLLHSRGAAGERETVDFNELVSEQVHLAYLGTATRLVVNLDPAIGKVELVPQDFGRALVNLVNNAFYAAGPQGVVSVTTRALAGAVEVAVRDNGPGIAPEIRDKIFNPFFTTKPAGAGTGLGLSMAHDIIVQLHGGSLRVESEVGEFTEFVVTLPR